MAILKIRKELWDTLEESTRTTFEGKYKVELIEDGVKPVV